MRGKNVKKNTTGTIRPTYVEDIPEEFKEQLICVWER